MNISRFDLLKYSWEIERQEGERNLPDWSGLEISLYVRTSPEQMR
jgi:hypothetical protein